MPNCFNINIMYHRTQKAEISQTIAQKLATTFMAFITIPTLTALPTYFMFIKKIFFGQCSNQSHPPLVLGEKFTYNDNKIHLVLPPPSSAKLCFLITFQVSLYQQKQTFLNNLQGFIKFENFPKIKKKFFKIVKSIFFAHLKFLFWLDQ